MLPKILTSRLQSILGEDYPHVMDAFSHERQGSFRLNLLKTDGIDVFREFEEKGIIVTPFVKGGRGDLIPEQNPHSHKFDSSFTEELGYLFDRVHEYAIKGTRAFYDGKIYLQSIASMLPVFALAPKKGTHVLDVCAAPGSKTTQLAMLMQNEGEIMALEQNQIRYDKLMHNCRLQGVGIVTGMKIDARKYLQGTTPLFGQILLDAPCSAEGRINLGNEKSYGFWSIENIRNKSNLQYELLSLSWKHLEKGGSLVYSTCTLAPEENEGVISRFLLENGDVTLEDIDLGLSHKPWWRAGLTEFEGQEYDVTMKKAVRILPSSETEGFFLVKMKKL